MVENMFLTGYIFVTKQRSAMLDTLDDYVENSVEVSTMLEWIKKTRIMTSA